LHLPLLDLTGCHRLEFHKRRQLFIGVHNETLSVAVMRVCNPELAKTKSI
jgi:hypothetical protein